MTIDSNGKVSNAENYSDYPIYGAGSPYNGLSKERKEYYENSGLPLEEQKRLIQQEKGDGRLSTSAVRENKETNKAQRRKAKKDKADQRELNDIGFDPKKDDPDKEEELPLSNIDLFEMGLDVLKTRYGKHIKVVYDSSDAMHGGLVFGLKSPLNPTPGVQAPIDYRYYKTPKLFIADIAKSLSSIKHKQVRDYWTAIFDGSPYSTKISKNAQYIECIDKHKSISIDGNTAFKVIPKKEWFNPAIVENVDPYDMLAILPRAEADMFMLHLGRLCAGAGFNPSHRENEVVECLMSTSYRYACLLNGEPQLGKSTLRTLIIDALTPLGYNFGSISEAMNQFSFATIANVSGVFVDDSSEEFIKKIISSASFKSIVAGQPIVAEVKGVQNPASTPTSACFFLAGNFTTFPHVKDSGVRSRLKILNCKTRTEIDNLSKIRGMDMRTYHYFKVMAERLGVTMRDLTLYLLRVSLDKYLDAVGVSKNEEGEWSQVEDGRLEDIVKSLEDKFRFQYKEAAETVLPIAARKSVAMVEALTEVLGLPQMSKPEEFDDSFSAFSIIYMARVMDGIRRLCKDIDVLLPKHTQPEDQQALTNLKACLTQCRDFLGLEDISYYIWGQVVHSWITSIGSIDSNYLLGAKGKGVEELWDFCNKQITLKNGTKINPSRPDYDAMFKVALRNSQAYKDIFTQLFASSGVDFTDDQIVRFLKTRLYINYYFCE